MANSKFEYVRNFETPDSLLPETWIVIRIDGRGFHKLSAKYGWEKPNDRRAIDLMNEAAKGVMKEVQDLVVAYGQSDEYSFVFPPSTTLFDRRASKLTTTIVSTFTSHYIHHWSSFFPTAPLTTLSPLPTFDGRAIVYPTLAHLRDYLSWRQADCHINNLYNTTFWALVQQGGRTAREAEEELKGTFAPQKNEILWAGFGVNYNAVEAVWRKGSVVYRDMKERRGNGEKGVAEAEAEGVFNCEKQDAGPVFAEDMAADHEAVDEAGRDEQVPNSHDSKQDAATAPAPAQVLATEDEAPETSESETIQGTGMQTQSPMQDKQKPAQQAPQEAKTKARNNTSKEKSNKPLSKTQLEKRRKRRMKAVITIEHVDIIKDTFWDERPWILSDS